MGIPVSYICKNASIDIIQDMAIATIGIYPSPGCSFLPKARVSTNANTGSAGIKYTILLTSIAISYHLRMLMLSILTLFLDLNILINIAKPIAASAAAKAILNSTKT